MVDGELDEITPTNLHLELLQDLLRSLVDVHVGHQLQLLRPILLLCFLVIFQIQMQED